MFKHLFATATMALAAALASPAMGQAPPPSWTQVGFLNCQLAPSIGFSVGSQQRMTCQFAPSAPYPPQGYLGVMTSIGLDIGITAGGALGWAVFAPTEGPAFGGLAGTYVGATGEISIGLGGGANVLIGGS